MVSETVRLPLRNLVELKLAGIIEQRQGRLPCNTAAFTSLSHLHHQRGTYTAASGRGVSGGRAS